MSFRATLVSFALLSSPLFAQDLAYVPEGRADGQKTGPCNVFPFGVQKQEWISGNQKYQTLVPLSFLKLFRGRTISEIAFAPCGGGVYRFDSLRITMAQTTANDLAKKFAANLAGSPKVVLDARSYHWQLTQDTWSPIGLQDPYAFDLTKGNLVIDIEARGAKYLNPTGKMGFHRAASFRRMYRVGWKTVPPAEGTMSMLGLKLRISGNLAALGTFGLGCQGSNQKTQTLSLSGSARPAGTVTTTLANALPGAPALLILGRNNKAPLTLPYSSCTVYTIPGVSLALLTSTSGGASVALPIPSANVFLGAKVYTQFLVVDIKANRSWMATSNYGRIAVGL